MSDTTWPGARHAAGISWPCFGRHGSPISGITRTSPTGHTYTTIPAATCSSPPRVPPHPPPPSPQPPPPPAPPPPPPPPYPPPPPEKFFSPSSFISAGDQTCCHLAPTFMGETNPNIS